MGSDPEIPRRDIAERAGVSLAEVSARLRALIGRGRVEVRNSRAPDNKQRRARVFTPLTIAERAAFERRLPQRERV